MKIDIAEKKKTEQKTKALFDVLVLCFVSATLFSILFLTGIKKSNTEEKMRDCVSVFFNFSDTKIENAEVEKIVWEYENSKGSIDVFGYYVKEYGLTE